MHEVRAKATPPKEECRWQGILHVPTPRGRLWGRMKKRAVVSGQNNAAHLINLVKTDRGSQRR
jgi:hypothetical protein